LAMDTSDGRIGIIQLPFAIPNTARVFNPNKNTQYSYTLINPFTLQELEYDNIVFVRFTNLSKSPNTSNQNLDITKRELSSLNQIYHPYLTSNLFGMSSYFYVANPTLNDYQFRRKNSYTYNPFDFNFLDFKIYVKTEPPSGTYPFTVISYVNYNPEIELNNSVSYVSIDNYTFRPIVEYKDVIRIEKTSSKQTSSPSQLFIHKFKNGYDNFDSFYSYSISSSGKYQGYDIKLGKICYSSGSSTDVKLNALQNNFGNSILEAIIFNAKDIKNDNTFESLYRSYVNTTEYSFVSLTSSKNIFLVLKEKDTNYSGSNFFIVSSSNLFNYTQDFIYYERNNDFSKNLGNETDRKFTVRSYSRDSIFYLDSVYSFRFVPVRNLNIHYKYTDLISHISIYENVFNYRELVITSLEEVINYDKNTNPYISGKIIISTTEFLNQLPFVSATRLYILKDLYYNPNGNNLRSILGLSITENLPYFKIYTYFDDIYDIINNTNEGQFNNARNIYISPKGYINPFIDLESIRDYISKNAGVRLYFNIATLSKDTPNNYDFYAVIDKWYLEQFFGDIYNNTDLSFNYVQNNTLIDNTNNINNIISNNETDKILIRNQTFKKKHLNWIGYLPPALNLTQYVYDNSINYLVPTRKYENDNRLPLVKLYIPIDNELDVNDVEAYLSGYLWKYYINTNRYNQSKYQDRIGADRYDGVNKAYYVRCSKFNLFAFVVGNKILCYDAFNTVQRIPAIFNYYTPYDGNNYRFITNIYDYFVLQFNGVNNFNYNKKENLTDNTNLIITIRNDSNNRNNNTSVNSNTEVIYTKYIDIIGCSDNSKLFRNVSYPYYTKPINKNDIKYIYRIEPVFVSTQKINYYIIIKVIDNNDNNKVRYYLISNINETPIVDITEAYMDFLNETDLDLRKQKLLNIINNYNANNGVYNIEFLNEWIKEHLPDNVSIQFGIIFSINTSIDYGNKGYDTKFYGINLLIEFNNNQERYYKYIKYAYYDSNNRLIEQYGSISSDTIIFEAIPSLYYIIEKVDNEQNSTYDYNYISDLDTNTWIIKYDKPIKCVFPLSTMLHGGFMHIAW